MNRYKTWVMGLAIVVVLAPSAALAKGTFKGTFGPDRFKSNKRVVLCSYGRAASTFSIGGAQVSRKRQRTATAGGTGADPSAPGAAFPIVLTAAVATYSSGSAASATTWTGGIVTSDLVVTLTGYRKGKVSGTIAGTFTPSDPGAGAPFQATASFAAKCDIQ